MANSEEKGLPQNIDAERFVLGSILLDDALYAQAAGMLEADDFSLQKHRLIFKRMGELQEDSERIDRVTVANRLMMFNELEACDGLSYLTSLDDGLPHTPKIDSYARIVKDKSRARKLIFAAQNIMSRAFLEGETPDQILQAAEKSLATIEASGLRGGPVSIEQILEEHHGIQGFTQNAIGPGIPFAEFPQFDEHFLGLQEGSQYVIGGRPGSGKSALAANIAVAVARAGHAVHILSLEMPKEAMLARMLCGAAEVPLKPYFKKVLTAEQRDKILHAAGELAGLPLYIDDTPGMTITGMIQSVNRSVREKKTRLFITDHANRVDWQGDPALRLRTEYEGVTKVSWAGTLLCRKHKISHLLLCQLSRPADKRKEAARPTMSELRSSGALEQDATGIMLIHREEMYFPGRPDLKGQAQIGIPKSRNGTIGDVELEFVSKYTRFIDHGDPGFDSGTEED